MSGVSFTPLDSRGRPSPRVMFFHQVPCAPRPMDGLIVALVSIGISFVATIYPSWAASRILRAEALPHE